MDEWETIKKEDSGVDGLLGHVGPRRSICKQCRQIGKAKQQASNFSLTTKAAPCLSINHEEQRHGAYGKDAAIISWNKCELATHLRSKASATLAKAQCAVSANHSREPQEFQRVGGDQGGHQPRILECCAWSGLGPKKKSKA